MEKNKKMQRAADDRGKNNSIALKKESLVIEIGSTNESHQSSLIRRQLDRLNESGPFPPKNDDIAQDLKQQLAY